MKLLLITQYYDPENLPINFVSRLLSQSEIEVDVITGKPNYPEGKFHKNFGFFSKIHYKQDRNSRGSIYRVPILPRGSAPFRGFKLAINYISFVISASIIPFFYIRKNQYDLVFVYANSPILKTIPALFIANRKKVPVLLWVQDLWPQSFEASGFRLPKIIKKILVRIVKFIYEHTNLIACQSVGFKKKIHEEYGIPYSKLAYLPNTVDDVFENPTDTKNLSLIKILKPYEKNFNIVFTGNIGEAQAVHNILLAAKIIQKSSPKIHFIFIGSGSKLEEMKQYQKDHSITNVSFLGRFPVQDMPTILSASSALIISLKKDPIFSLTVPNKLQSYLAAGKPVIGSIEGEGKQIIHDAECGFTCPPDQPEVLAALCKKMFDLDDATREVYGKMPATSTRVTSHQEVLLRRSRI